MSELEFIAALRDLFRSGSPDVLVGAGYDDCALVRAPGGELLCLTTDTLLEGTHFRAQDAPEAIGWKAVAVNLSDLAAAGCRPLWGLVGVGLRRGMGEAWSLALATGMQACAAAYGLSLVGGDTTSGEGPTSLTITVVGTPLGGAALRRSGAQPGDLLLVTGALGGSLPARHLRPFPRLSEIRAIRELVRPTAAMDLSDGLALDLSRLAAESRVGAVLDAERIPLHPDALALATLTGRDPLEHALGDGEDFELLFTLPPTEAEKLLAAWPPAGLETPLRIIGETTSEPELRLRAADGQLSPLPRLGYTHEF